MVCRFITIQIKAPMSQFTDLQIDCKVYMERQKKQDSQKILYEKTFGELTWTRSKQCDLDKRTYKFIEFISVQSLSRVRLFVTPWIAAHQASQSITKSQSSLRLTSIQSVTPSSHLILYCPLFFQPPIPPSIKVFSSESTLPMRCSKYWSFSFSIIHSKEHPGLISFRMDWLDLLAVRGTLKSLLQHHSSKASILRCTAFFTVQLTSILDHWKNHSLD